MLQIRAKRNIDLMWEKQNGKCYFCNCDTYLHKYEKGVKMKPNGATREHIIPQSENGPTSPANLVMSCLKCNSNRSSMNFVEWFRIASNPETLKKYYADKIIRVRENKAKRSLRNFNKKRDLELFGVCHSFSDMSASVFIKWFGKNAYNQSMSK